MTIFIRFRVFTIMALLLCLASMTGCALTMRNQPRYEPLEASPFFADGASARPRVADTVAAASFAWTNISTAVGQMASLPKHFPSR